AETDPAGRRLIDPGDHVESRRLARPVGTDQPDQLAFADGGGQSGNGGQAAEPDRDILEFQQRGAHAAGRRLGRIENRPPGRNSIRKMISKAYRIMRYSEKSRSSSGINVSRMAAAMTPTVRPMPPRMTMTTISTDFSQSKP